MKYGKLTQTAWMRSVRRQLHIEGQKTLFRPSPFETCSGLLCGSGDPAGNEALPGDAVKGAGADGEKCFLWADAHASGTSPQTGYYAVLQAAGELAAKGVSPAEISVRILFPPEAEEVQLKALTAGIVSACSRLGLTVDSFQGETTFAAAGVTVFVTAAGVAEKSRLISAEETGTVGDIAAAPSPGMSGQKSGEQEILLCGYAGLEGTLRILDEAEEELGTRFVSTFLEQVKELSKDLVTPPQILALHRDSGRHASVGGKDSAGRTAAPRITVMRQITGGGILAALWELSETLGTGFEIEMSAISLKQETVEMCEFYRLNPYQMTSAGSFLIVTKDAQEAIDFLEKAGARAVRLGVTKAQNMRVITSGEEVRYLDRPAPDELVSWMADRRRASDNNAGRGE